MKEVKVSPRRTRHEKGARLSLANEKGASSTDDMVDCRKSGIV